MNREQALDLLKQNIFNVNLIKHSLAVEAVMKSLARHFNADEEKWGLSGLLHDIDYEETKNDPARHSLIGARMLEGLKIDQEIIQAIKVHNEAHGILPETLMEKSLYISDPLTGLITAAVLILPSKKLADLKAESVINRFYEKSFAKGASREIIKKCEEYLDLKLEDFIKIGLKTMQEIAEDLGF